MHPNTCVQTKTGHLHLILGAMFSGKTTRLIQIYKTRTYIGKKVVVINYLDDKRYHETMMSTHDHQMIPCIQISELSALCNDPTNEHYHKIKEADTILINEGQFFADIVEWVTIAVEKYHKNVYICGLNSDFKRQKFGNWLELETISDNVVMLHSFCSKCKRRPGIFSHRLSGEAELEVIGADCYIPVCRKCYKENTIR